MTDLLTPIVLKESQEWSWPDDERVFYVLARTGLFVCRNHRFFRSCATAKGWPSELAPQEEFLEPSFPVLPQDQMELAVGFFHRIAETQNAEAGGLLVWNEMTEEVRFHVPDQVATVRRGYSGHTYPIGLHYDTTPSLADGEVVYGDIHSHVWGAAYASGVDVHDEVHKPGLHIVVGRLDEDPPDFHVDAVADGSRFEMELDDVVAGYTRRDAAVPQSWIDKVRIEVEPPYYYYRSDERRWERS